MLYNGAMEKNKLPKKEWLKKVLLALKDAYPDPRPELIFSSPFELLVSTMLAAQCTDKQVNKCTSVLYPVYNTPEQMSKLSKEELEPYIKSCGLYKTKCANIIRMSRILVEQHDGEVPQTREALTKLPGVGRKTANVVLSNAFGIPAIAVDTHVFRVANRIGLANAKDVRKTEEQLMKNIPKQDWGDAHHWLIFHGRRVCSARNPKCGQCAVSEYCKARDALCNLSTKQKST